MDVDVKTALGILTDAVDRCRKEDMRTAEVYTALNYLTRKSGRKWPFQQFRDALDGFNKDPLQEEGRWQTLNASLNAIRLAVLGGN